MVLYNPLEVYGKKLTSGNNYHVIDKLLILYFRTSSEVLQGIMNDVMMTCVRIGEMVSPVVCNSSPEGFLPTREKEGKEILDDERKVFLHYVHAYVVLMYNYAGDFRLPW